MVTGPDGRLAAAARALGRRWQSDLPDAIAGLVRVPGVSPAFDAGWAARGALDEAAGLVSSWLSSALAGATVTRLQLPGRTPVLLCDVPAAPGAQDGKLVLVYGHLDKQPAGQGWSRTGPFEPLRTEGRLYGRGSADDGYAPFLAGAVLAEMRAAGVPHPRVIFLLEASEESSSADLPAYLDSYRDRLGDPAVVICLDGFVPDHEQLWVTVSMRGILIADLQVSLLEQGMHSGIAGGVVASSFRVLRGLLDRVEDAASGTVLLPELSASIPEEHRRLLARQAAVTGPPAAWLGLLPGVEPAHADPVAQLIAQCWEPSVGYVGISGAPPVDEAGSVLRASTTVRLSVRLPPTTDPDRAAAALARTLTSAPPYRARVEFRLVAAESGWVLDTGEQLRAMLEAASRRGYSAGAQLCGGGGTIPFLGMFSARYPQAAILPLGVLGPSSNAHGPDEYLDLDAAGKLSVALASLLADLAAG